jgi:hypothetical protein
MGCIVDNCTPMVGDNDPSCSDLKGFLCILSTQNPFQDEWKLGRLN